MEVTSISNPGTYSDRVTQGLHRHYDSPELHFIASCYHRQPQLGTAKRCDLILKIPEETRRRFRFVVHGHVLMPEHFHLLIRESRTSVICIATR
jgi:REP element-mobilizing transposase RayT